MWERAGRETTVSYKGSNETLENVVGYLAGTMDFHVKMTSKNPAQSFRCRATGVTTAPFYEE